ncbi:MAG TPA: DEAD/DEAH box helicase [Terracidiphilus sp.]|jgi:SWI/SNF-related matrix-associated actin-dependent regulator 1 of chromatin subfamily A|nr:DEAD/DEAH box helicase [Terracidiphilus sp.]
MNTTYRAPLITPYPYQVEAAQWAAQRRDSLIGDSPGLGKTASAIRACDLVGAANILVVAPASVRIQWGREFERFSPLDRPMQICMPSDIPNTSGVVILFYDQAVKYQELLMSVRWNCLIIDECHYLKERYKVGKKTSGYRTKCIYGFGKRFPGLITVCDRVIRLSGTPAPNNASELWTHLKSAGLTDQPYWDHTFHFCNGFDSEHGFRFTSHKNVPELQKLLAPFMLRRTKAEVQPDLHEPMFETITVARSDAALPPELQALVPQLDQADTQLQEALSSGSPGDQLSTLESMASSLATLRRYTAMAKLPALAEQIEEDLTTNQIPKLVVFAIHKICIRWLAEKLAKFHPLTISGDTPAEKRQPNIDRFQSDPSVRLIIGNIAAMGTGVDGLQNVCDEAIFVEQDWVPSSNAQAIMRLCRIGQKNPVRARIFSLYGSVDERVQDVLADKMRELARIL